MYIDAKLQFSDEQALTASAASTNVIDLGGDHNVGIGEPMAVVVSLDVAADDSDADETYSCELQTDSSDAFGSAVGLGSQSIPAGSAAGSKFVFPVPADERSDRYFRLNFTLGGTTPSVTVSAFMIPQNMIQNYVSYPDGFVIS